MASKVGFSTGKGYFPDCKVDNAEEAENANTSNFIKCYDKTGAALGLTDNTYRSYYLTIPDNIETCLLLLKFSSALSSMNSYVPFYPTEQEQDLIIPCTADKKTIHLQVKRNSNTIQIRLASDETQILSFWGFICIPLSL